MSYEFRIMSYELRVKSSFSRLAAFGLRYAPEHPRSARKASQAPSEELRIKETHPDPPCGGKEPYVEWD